MFSDLFLQSISLMGATFTLFDLFATSEGTLLSTILLISKFYLILMNMCAFLWVYMCFYVITCYIQLVGTEFKLTLVPFFAKNDFNQPHRYKYYVGFTLYKKWHTILIVS